jgi:hypothetical protein
MRRKIEKLKNGEISSYTAGKIKKSKDKASQKRKKVATSKKNHGGNSGAGRSGKSSKKQKKGQSKAKRSLSNQRRVAQSPGYDYHPHNPNSWDIVGMSFAGSTPMRGDPAELDFSFSFDNDPDDIVNGQDMWITSPMINTPNRYRITPNKANYRTPGGNNGGAVHYSNANNRGSSTRKRRRALMNGNNPPTPDSENKLLRAWMGQDLSPMPTPGSTQMNGMWSPKLQPFVSPQAGGRTMNAPTPGSYIAGGNAALQAGLANSTPVTNETDVPSRRFKTYATKREQERMRQKALAAKELEEKRKGKVANTSSSAPLSITNTTTSNSLPKNSTTAKINNNMPGTPARLKKIHGKVKNTHTMSPIHPSNLTDSADIFETDDLYNIMLHSPAKNAILG